MAAIITQNQTKWASDADLAQMLREVEAMTERKRRNSLPAKARRAEREIDMSDISQRRFQTSAEQQAIRDKCFHPSSTFVEFSKEDVETSILKDLRRSCGVTRID
jgi:hypothetical protein